jgi:hypothetical protein
MSHRCFTLRHCARALILLRPIRTARMHEEDFESVMLFTEHEKHLSSATTVMHRASPRPTAPVWSS